MDISDSLAAITAATSNGQLSAVLDAASSVTASNTSLADAVALSADTHVAHSTVDFVQLAESARDNTSYSAQEYVVAISANVTNPILIPSNVSDKLANIQTYQADLADAVVHAEDVDTLDAALGIANGLDQGPGGGADYSVIDTWHAKDTGVGQNAVLDAGLAADLKDISVNQLFNLGILPADNQSLLLSAVTVEDEFSVIEASLSTAEASVYGQLEADSVHAIDADLNDAVDLLQAREGNPAGLSIDEVISSFDLATKDGTNELDLDKIGLSFNSDGYTPAGSTTAAAAAAGSQSTAASFEGPYENISDEVQYFSGTSEALSASTVNTQPFISSNKDGNFLVTGPNLQTLVLRYMAKYLTQAAMILRLDFR